MDITHIELELGLWIIGWIMVLGFLAIGISIARLDNKLQAYISARSHRQFLEDEDKRIKDEMSKRSKEEGQDV